MAILPPVTRTRPFLPFLWLFGAICVLFTGCAPQATPDLIELQDINPPTLEAGTELHLEGSGFPENRPGTLILSGMAYIPARAPEAVRWELPLRPDSSSSIHFRLEEKLLRQQLKGAAHATFRGTAELIFKPIARGRPQLRGTKKDLVLDLFTNETGDSEQANRFALFLGVELSEALVVTELMADSPAAQAGLQVGDRVHALDQVRLDSINDFVPQAHAQTSVLEYSRDGFHGRAEAHLERADFQILDRSLAARSLAAILAVLVALLLAARPPRFLVWLFGNKTPARRGHVTWLAGGTHRSQAIAYPLFLGIAASFWWLSHDQQRSFSQWDFVLCLAIGSVLLFVASFQLGGKKTHGRGFSLLGAVAAILARTVVILPILASALSRASEVGSLRLRDLAAIQGPLPHGWALFDSPWSFLLGGAYLVALIPLAGRRPPLEGHPGNVSSDLIVARALEWSGHLVLLCLWISIFAGGIVRPGDNVYLSAGLFCGKLALLIQGICWVRARMGGIRVGESWALFGSANLGLSLLGASLSLGTLVAGLRENHAEVLGLFAATLAASLVLFSLISSQRSWAHMGRRIDPWI